LFRNSSIGRFNIIYTEYTDNSKQSV
jgi:hypothetical protein